jgi:hypothetical protein
VKASIKLHTVSALTLLAAAGGGCAFRSNAVLGGSGMIRAYPDRPCKVVGLVHAETWCAALFYKAKLGSASLETATMAMEAEARNLGADAIVNVKNHVEVHMPLPVPFIAGWHEYHVWGTAVRYE